MNEASSRLRRFQQLREKKTALTGASESIPRRGPEPSRLSFGQQRLWFLEQLEPGNPRFNILTAVRMRGPVRIDLLIEVLNEIVRRHESLRTRIEIVDGEPVQSVLPELKIDIPLVDLATLGPGRQESCLRSLAVEAARRPFDFERGPFFRAPLLRLGERHFVFVLVMHQIVVDRWSRGILVNEIVTLYEAFSDGKPSPLPELPIQYADFAVWQRAHLQGELLQRLLSYWKEQLAPPVPVLEIPTDHPRPALLGHRGQMQYYVVPQDDLDLFKRLLQRENVTLFMGLLGVLSVLLHRYTGQEDFVVGSPIASRNRKEIEPLIGFFLNMLALRVRPRGGMEFRDLLQMVKHTALGAFDQQELPFERLVEELGCERSLSHHPLFQVSAVLQNAPMPALNLRHLAVSLIEVDWGTTAFDLSFFFWETEMWESLERGLSLVTTSSAELFAPATVSRMVAHFKNLLQEASLDPARKISDLPLLSTAETHQLLCEWNDASASLPREASLPRLFEAQVERTPASVALEFDGRCLTYRQLNRLGNRVAHRLRALGVTVGGAVGIVAEPSWKMIAGLLGILKAGGAYLPIDRQEPGQRSALMLQEAGASVLLTFGEDTVATPAAVPRLALEDCWRGPDEETAGNLPVGTGNSPACILFTSGSTGTPKGVVISHQAISRLVFNPRLPLTAGERIGQAANLAFDAATFEIWASLLHGASLVKIDRVLSLSSHELSELLAARKITSLFLPTALFRRIASENPAAFRALRLLLVGGETAPPDAFSQVLAHGRPGRLLHVYGPTECTTFATAHEVTSVPYGSSVPIGRPIANTSVQILDPGMRAVPVGVWGAIYLGGEGLASGYAGRPELTAERFVPHPWPPAPGARLFHSGDVGRFRPDGSIEIRGRRDRQVKLRGFRVEPAEVEAALAAHREVCQALVVPIRTSPDDLELVAYVVLAEGSEVSEEQMLAHLRQRLPAFMIPCAVQAVAAFPLTSRGKADLSALPALRTDRREKVASAPPRNEMEHLVAGIWEEVLGRRLGIYDDFFEAGGHSLHVTRVVSRLRRALQGPVSVRDLFDHRTVAALADSLRARRPDQDEGGLR